MSLIPATGSADGVIYVTDEREWQQAQADGRPPQAIAYPNTRVRRANEDAG